jgi:hypothetical protein
MMLAAAEDRVIAPGGEIGVRVPPLVGKRQPTGQVAEQLRLLEVAS